MDFAFSVLALLATLLALWLWCRAARAAEAALLALPDTAKLGLVPSPGRLRFMAYLLQGFWPLMTWLVIHFALFFVNIVYHVEVPVFRTPIGFADIDYLGRLMHYIIEPLELRLIVLLLVFGYLAYSRNWRIVPKLLWLTLAALVFSVILGMLEGYLEYQKNTIFSWSVPIYLSTLLGLAVVIALFWAARAARPGLAAALLIVCFASAAPALAHKSLLAYGVGITPDRLELIALPGAPARAVFSLPFRIDLANKVDNPFFTVRKLYFNWLVDYYSSDTEGVPGWWTIYLDLLANLGWLALIYMAMLRYSDEDYTLARLKEELDVLKRKLDTLITGGREADA